MIGVLLWSDLYYGRGFIFVGVVGVVGVYYDRSFIIIGALLWSEFYFFGVVGAVGVLSLTGQRATDARRARRPLPPYAHLGCTRVVEVRICSHTTRHTAQSKDMFTHLPYR